MNLCLLITSKFTIFTDITTILTKLSVVCWMPIGIITLINKIHFSILCKSISTFFLFFLLWFNSTVIYYINYVSVKCTIPRRWWKIIKTVSEYVTNNINTMSTWKLKNSRRISGTMKLHFGLHPKEFSYCWHRKRHTDYSWNSIFFDPSRILD